MGPHYDHTKRPVVDYSKSIDRSKNFCYKNRPRSYYAVNCGKKSFLRFSRSLIIILQSKFKNSKWRIQYGGHFLLNSNSNFTNCVKMNVRVALRTLITIPRSKMRNWKWRIQYGGAVFTKFDVLRSNCTKMKIRGFSRTLITIPRSKMRN